MYITVKELERRLKEEAETGITSIVERKRDGARGKNKTHEERVAAGTLGKLIGNSEAAEVLDIDRSNIRRYEKGIKSQEQGLDEKLRDDITEKVEGPKKTAAEKQESIKNQALDNLVGALTKVGNKIGDAKSLKEVSSVALDMAKVVESFAPKSEKDGGTKVNIMIQVPPQADIKSYDVIEVSPKNT